MAGRRARVARAQADQSEEAAVQGAREALSQFASASPAAFGPWLLGLVVGLAGYRMPGPGYAAAALMLLTLMLLQYLPSTDRQGRVESDHLALGAFVAATLVAWVVLPSQMEALQLAAVWTILIVSLGIVVLTAEGRFRPRPSLIELPEVWVCSQLGLAVDGLLSLLVGLEGTFEEMRTPTRLIFGCVAAFYFTILIVVWYSFKGTAQAVASAPRWPGVGRWCAASSRECWRKAGSVRGGEKRG